MNRPDDRVANVRWAMTGARIRELLVDAGTRVTELKEELEQSARTPARFLDLICDGAVLPDDACASYSFARSEHVEPRSCGRSLRGFWISSCRQS